MGKIIDLAGERFGMLFVKHKLDEKGGGAKWVCECDCGEFRTVKGGHLRAGYFKSCGCHVGRHGHSSNGSRSREYTSYYNMMARCHKPTNKRYKDYGAKGILVCDEWRGSFNSFIGDMGDCPEDYQIERIDNNKGYSKGNCKWASRKENMRNRKNSSIWFVKGKVFYTLDDAGSEFNVSSNTIRAWCVGRVVGDIFYQPKENCYRESVY